LFFFLTGINELDGSITGDPNIHTVRYIVHLFRAIAVTPRYSSRAAAIFAVCRRTACLMPLTSPRAYAAYFAMPLYALFTLLRDATPCPFHADTRYMPLRVLPLFLRRYDMAPYTLHMMLRRVRDDTMRCSMRAGKEAR